MRLEPANSIIIKLGGLKAVSDITGRDQTTVLRWRYPKEKGGTGGHIPNDHIQTLLNAARQDGVSLSLEDFFPKEAAK